MLPVNFSGSVKARFLESLAGYLDLPVVTADTTSLTEASIVVGDMESLLSPGSSWHADDDQEFADRGSSTSTRSTSCV